LDTWVNRSGRSRSGRWHYIHHRAGGGNEERLAIRQGEIRSLTGVRGLAAAMVAFMHLSSGKIGGIAITHSYLAVDLFFVLSGFVMALNYGRGFTAGFSWPAYASFLWRRFARVYPLYFAATVVMAVLWYRGFALFGGPFSPLLVAANFVLAQAWGLGDSLVYSGWSLSTELAAYLLFPWLVAVALRHSTPKCWAAAGLSFAAILWLSLLPASATHRDVSADQASRYGPLNFSDGATIWLLVRCLPEFMLGLLAWRLWTSSIARKLFVGPVTTALGLLIAWVWMMPESDVVLVCLFALMIAALGHQRGLVARALGSRPMHALGNWSYGVYVIHPLLTLLVVPFELLLAGYGASHAWALSVLFMTGASVVAGWLAHMLLEQPAQRWLCSPVRLTRPGSLVT
jgi:peptidoglycan/LPS O-acetylase OafA/YrhL